MKEENDIQFSGRQSNKELGNYRMYGKSKHQQYFTPMDLSTAIFEMLVLVTEGHVMEDVSVLDPTCGSGRLLVPWKKAGARTLGIELDKETAAVAVRLLGKKCVRTGDILDYAPHLDGFNFVVTNPPFGIWWDVSGKAHSFDSECYGGSIESQAATLEISTDALAWNGILATIIPSSTFSSEKNRKLRQFLFENYRILLKASFKNVFSGEYGIAVEVDLVVAQKIYNPGAQSYEQLETDMIMPGWKNSLLQAFKNVLENEEIAFYPGREICVPHLDALASIPVTNSLNITSQGVRGELSAVALLDFLDNTHTAYNPVRGMETGLSEAYFTRCALIVRGFEDSGAFLNSLGFNVKIEDGEREKLRRLFKQFKAFATPVYRPRPHQLLAYYYEQEYTARETVRDDSGIVFKKGKPYHFRPTWVRRRETVKLTTAYDESKKKNVTIQTDVDRGYLAFRVGTNQGEKLFEEINLKDVEMLAKAFPLPEIKDVDELYPERIALYRVRVERDAPFLFDYQKEDIARLAMKPFGYIGYDMGGGKSVTAASWAKLKGYKAVLVVCQSGLIGNWLNELSKFGFAAERMANHKSVDRVMAAIRSGLQETRFFITSYEFLSLDTGRRYDPWDCIEFDKEGNVMRAAKSITSRKCPLCHRSYENVIKQCPKCGADEQWTGAFCRACGHRAFTYTSDKRMYPAYKRIGKLFDCVIVDEAQLAKTKNSGRGRAVRALKAKGKLILTGTLMKGYVTDVFWNLGWLLGFGNPLFPFPYRGGSKQFLNEFGTFEFVTKQYEDTLSEGRARMIPEVSNLNRFWRLMGAFTIRRLKDEMVELPEKKKHVLLLEMDKVHAGIYEAYQDWAGKRISKALHEAEGEQVNMGVISACLWKLRFAATVPVAKDYLCDGSGPELFLDNGLRWNKLRKLVEIVEEIKKKNEKVVIFSGLRPMVSQIAKTLKAAGIGFIPITASSPTKTRFDLIEKFGRDRNITAIVGGLNCLNRGFTIVSAQNVIITDLEYSPESVLQAEDRVHRTGQEKEVNIYYLFSKGTIDDVMFELISKKQAAISNAIDGKARHEDVAKLLESIGNIQLEVAKRIMKRPVLVVKKEETVPSNGNAVVYTPDVSKVVLRRDLNLPANKKAHPNQIELFGEI